MDNFRCHQLYVNEKRTERVGYIVYFSPHNTNIKFIYSADYDPLVAAYLTNLLINPNHEAPFVKIRETQL